MRWFFNTSTRCLVKYLLGLKLIFGPIFVGIISHEFLSASIYVFTVIRGFNPVLRAGSLSIVT
jgi:hypothetical protein